MYMLLMSLQMLLWFNSLENYIKPSNCYTFVEEEEERDEEEMDEEETERGDGGRMRRRGYSCV